MNIIFILFIIIPQIINENTEKFLDIAGSILKAVDSECYNDVTNILNIEKNTSTKYPWILDYVGKGLNDLGDETECINSLVDTSFIIIRSKANSLDEYEKFLNTQAYSYGFCINNKCKKTVLDNFEIIRQFLDVLFKNHKITNEGNMFELIESNRSKDNKEETNNNTTSYKLINLRTEDDDYIIALMIIFIVYIFIKIIAGILRMIFIPKGYNKYALEIFNQKENLGSIDEEEQINLSKRKESIITFSEGNLFEYDPNYDYSSFLPIKLRILRFFDIFNDIMLLTKKKK